LLADRAVSQQEFDQLTASTRTSETDIQAAEAALQVARLNVGYASVRAPIAGRTSRAHVTAGNLVGPEVVLTSIAGVARVHAYFDASEASFLRLQAAGQTRPEVRMGLANEEGTPHVGQLDFIDNRLDPRTGAIRLRASFDNRDGRFVPGMAVRLSMATSAPYPAVLVPDRAIGTDQTRKFVVVVGTDGQPQFRPVQPGTAFGPMRAVTGELKPGENIVVDGLQRIIPGVPVTPQVLPVDAQGMPVFPAPAGRQG
jgi:multidrug efflux system membrane fusion protein